MPPPQLLDLRLRERLVKYRQLVVAPVVPATPPVRACMRTCVHACVCNAWMYAWMYAYNKHPWLLAPLYPLIDQITCNHYVDRFCTCVRTCLRACVCAHTPPKRVSGAPMAGVIAQSAGRAVRLGFESVKSTVTLRPSRYRTIVWKQHPTTRHNAPSPPTLPNAPWLHVRAWLCVLRCRVSFQWDGSPMGWQPNGMAAQWDGSPQSL